MQAIILTILLSIAMPSVVHAWTYRSSTSSALTQVAMVIQSQQEATGESIRSWNEFDRVVGSNRFKALDDLQLRERFAFVDLPSPLPQQSGSVLLISRTPFRDTTMRQNWFGKRSKTLTEEGRWMLIKSERGIFSEWLSENRIGSWVADARLTLPEPDTVGSFPHESEYWRRVSLNTGMAVAIVGYLIFYLVRRFGRKRNRSL